MRLLTAILILFLKNGNSLNLECRYADQGFIIPGNLYSCYLENNLNINKPEDAIVYLASGNHESEKNDSDVQAFFVDSDKKIEYIPKNLENIFNNLKVIWIQNNHLQEIHQSDLKPFAKLVYIKLGFNDIQVLEEGLFDYNPNLQGIYLQSNKIFHIDENIFNNLVNKLTFFVLYSNECVNVGTEGDGTKINEIVNLLKQNCQDETYIKMSKNLKNLETKLNSLSIEKISIFIKNVESIEIEFSKSKFAKLTSMRKRIEELKKLARETQIKHKMTIDEPKSCISCCFNSNFMTVLKTIVKDMNNDANISIAQNLKYSILDEKLQNIEEIMTISASIFNKSLENANTLENLKEVVNTVVTKMDRIESKLDRILTLIKFED